MQREAIDSIIGLLPEQAAAFNGSDYPLPVKSALVGDGDIDIGRLREELLEKIDSDVKDVVEPVLLAAELYESTRDDRSRYFITDRDAQSYVFSGAKWRAGWVLVLGAEHNPQIVDELKERNFIVFTDHEGIADTVFIGNRPTSPVYFLQLMVRYGMVWGRIPPGHGHEMGHFLEDDMPGFLVISQDLDPLKYVVALGLMKLGAPAVVPSSFPFPYGRRLVADEAEEIVAKGITFPNLRVRYYEDEVIDLPEYCNPAYVNEQIEPEVIYGGGNEPFFCLRAVPSRAQSPDYPEVTPLRPGEPIGILVEIADERLTEDLADLLEEAALKTVNFIGGVCAEESAGRFRIKTRRDALLDHTMLREAISRGLRLRYPRLTGIDVRIITNLDLIRKEFEDVTAYKAARQKAVDEMTEENTDRIAVCTECRPFSLEHTCILTPDRIPMCGSRNYFTVKASALFGLSRVPNRRRSEIEIPLTGIFPKGEVIDVDRGEYEGANRAYATMTGGKLSRVLLHSVREAPHTSCGCFQNLAFWIEEVQGIGIMSRNSEAVTPTGLTWSSLANKAGGKQSPGITGVSTGYIRSPQFLRGDGGMANVVWVNHKLLEKIRDLLPPGHRVATDADVQTIEELTSFLGRDSIASAETS